MIWNDLEQMVFDDACDALSEISPKIAQETVIAFGFDCNSNDGTIIAVINTEEGLSRTVESYLKRSPSYAEMGETAVRAMLSESIGDFSHVDFAPRKFRNTDAYLEYKKSIERSPDFADFSARIAAITVVCEQFMTAVARAVIRLQNEGRFEVLNRAASFVSFCNDYQEDLIPAIARIERVRNESR